MCLKSLFYNWLLSLLKISNFFRCSYNLNFKKIGEINLIDLTCKIYLKKIGFIVNLNRTNRFTSEK